MSAASSTVHSPPRSSMSPLKTNKTEIFSPQLAHGQTRNVTVQGLKSEGRWTYDEARQTLTIATKENAPGTVHRVTVSVRPLPKAALEVNDFWGDFGGPDRGRHRGVLSLGHLGRMVILVDVSY